MIPVEEVSVAAESAGNGFHFVVGSGVISVAAAPAVETAVEILLTDASGVGVFGVRLRCSQRSGV